MLSNVDALALRGPVEADLCNYFCVEHVLRMPLARLVKTVTGNPMTTAHENNTTLHKTTANEHDWIHCIQVN
jgi:hypothetical protein